MSNPGSANLLHPGRENVHPLFDPVKFAPNIRYDAFYEGAVLATRLMNSPQSLQHDYCFHFGKTVPAATPADFVYKAGPSDLSCQYACDKAIGELSKADIRDVERQRLLLADTITFKLHDHNSEYGRYECAEYASGKRNSVIYINRRVYNEALNDTGTPEKKSRMNLLVACIFIHEVAHAAHFRLLGLVQEDYREDSHVAESGFEAVARIFGFTPHITDWCNGWMTWQYSNPRNVYDLTKVGRKEWQLPADIQVWQMRPEFLLKLSNDDFWTGEYLERGALALLCHSVPRLCQEFPDTKICKANIPLSIRDLFRTGGPSYAKKKYAKYANPERQLRTRPDYDYRFREMRPAGQ